MMVDVDVFKDEIRKRISQDYSLEFCGDDFDKIVVMISESKSSEIYLWVENIIKKEVQPIMPRKSYKTYKKWPVSDLLSFRKELNINNTDYRIMLLKVKNNFYIEFHLSTHNYYDKLRNKLGLTTKKY